MVCEPGSPYLGYYGRSGVLFMAAIWRKIVVLGLPEESALLRTLERNAFTRRFTLFVRSFLPICHVGCGLQQQQSR